jgi:hypothetical protein
MKSYLSGKINKKRQEKILYEESCEALSDSGKTIWEVHEQAPEPLFRKPASDPEEIKESLRIMLLTMKCTFDIDDDLIIRIASRIGTHSAVVFHLIEILRTTMRDRTDRIRGLKEQRRDNYFRIKYFLDMKKNCRDRFRSADLDKKIRRETKRYAAVCRRLSSAPKAPSHTDIARIMGVPKGTIDSGFFYIRKATEEFLKTADLRNPGPE